MRLPTVVVLPLTQGIGLLGGIILTTVLFRERLHPLKIIGLLVGILVLTTSIFREAIVRMFS